LLHDCTPGLASRLASGRPISGYNGFDPSGPSLHVGHLVPVFGLLHLQRHGGRPVALVGGATGMIGDPSGASAERNLLDRDTIAANAAAVRGQLGRFVDFSPGSGGAQMVNNLDWLGPLTMLDFLRDVGKHFTVPYMLGKESVQQRLERGLSFTEFSYMLLQSADFLHLYRTMGVEMQMGGADQWGNITAGLELIRRVEGVGEDGESPAHGIAYPLLTDPSGAKFGKTAAGTSVWLDPALTSPFAFYQFWLNAEDAVVGRLLRYFTLFSRAEIDALEADGAARPEARPGQRALARDITARVHGDQETDNARVASEAIFGGSVAGLSPAQKSFVAQVIERASPIPRTSFASGLSAAQIAVSSNTVTSMSEARRLILQGGLYINDERITDANELVPEPDDGRLFIRVGKRRYLLVPVED
jgi:tyrosyl-tRNA synthetase